MAIKGKKKSQTRGGQGQRRPATAPRPAYAGRRHTPWYKTTLGRMIAAIVLAVLAGLAIWAVADAQKESEQLTERQNALEDYTGRLRSLLETVSPAAGAMAAVPPSAEGADLDALRQDAADWSKTFTEAQTQAATMAPPAGADVANRLASQSVSLYLAAAQTYELVPKADRALQGPLLERASAQRDQASALWGTAIEAVDDERLDAEMELSGLTAPGAPGAQSPGGVPPGTEVEIPADAGGRGKAKTRKGTGGAAGAKEREDAGGNAGG